jgi:DNA-binding SARP family transcriptional activator
MVEIRLLGPVEALNGGARVALGPKPLALLALLALARGRVVSIDRILDELWAERPPETAIKVVQVYVSQLRKTLGATLIETREPGYRVTLAEEELDLARFEALTATARELGARARAARLHEALGLWRGAPLGGLREPFASSAAARLEELRLAALEERIAAELELGAGAELVPELERLVTEEPLRERLRGQLMLALYRGGRQAQALERYREGRAVLVEELGLEPGPALRDLERAILRQDPELAPAPARPPRTVLVLDEGLLALARPLAGADHELLVARIVGSPSELAEATEALRPLAGEARVAVFTSRSPAEDTIRLAREQDAALVLGRYAGLEELRALDALPCDLALSTSDMSPDQAWRHVPPGQAAAPVTVPFGGGEHEWAALELAVWLARAHGLPLRLVGSDARPERRDASRLLASASLVVQRFAGIVPEPALADPAALAEADASLLVVGLPDDWRDAGLGAAREALLAAVPAPLLLVRRGLRPGGLAPDESLTRFTWSLG